jgi:hypothetical protein
MGFICLQNGQVTEWKYSKRGRFPAEDEQAQIRKTIALTMAANSSTKRIARFFNKIIVSSPLS